MRAHAAVLLLLLALVSPVPTVAGAQTADAVWEQGHQLLRRGDYTSARQFYDEVANNRPDLAPRALLLKARAALAEGDTDSAEAMLQSLLTDYPSSDQLAGAYFSLEQTRRAAGDCTGALRALGAFETTAGPSAIGPYAAIQRAQCEFELADWPAELAAAKAALSIDGGGPRLTQIEALERAAEADLKLGRKQEALDFYNRSLELAGTRAYRAEMLFTSATVARALGQDTLAADRFRAVVVDYADQARAPGALDALVDMGRGGTVSLLQAGRVRFNDRDYRVAISLLGQVDPTSADWGAAQLVLAEAQLKLGNEDDARTALAAVTNAQSDRAGDAWLRLGQLDERGGDEGAAELDYLRMVDAAPDRAAEGLFHVGFTRFVRRDRSGALSAWQTGLASGPPAPPLQAQLYYWAAKAMGSTSSSDSAQQEAFNHAAAAAPESYYGLRAREQLDRSLSFASSLTAAGTSWLSLTPNEVQGRADWFAGYNTTPEGAAQDLDSLASLQRANTLLELGLRTEASWEVDGVMQQYAQANDLAHLSALADWATNHEQPQLALRIGKQIRDIAGLSNLPTAVQKQVYPPAWGDLVAEQAAAYGVDPLLMLAVIRQESSFDPRAQSAAQARGLTQIVPSTARNIASRLGRDDFELRDLYRPGVSLQFGTWFMSQLLHDYKGRVFPALAAYNAGGGSVARWLQRFGDDPDVLVEQIPLNETQTYLRIVYDNYWHYQNLYRP